MTERITPAIVTSRTLSDLNSSLAALERTTNELSSGNTILEPSDNPYGASQVIDLQSELEGLSGYESQAQNGISWESTASSAMTNIGEVTQRVRELLVEGANGTYNKNDLETMALQVEQIAESIKQDANTQYAGQYVFSGTATSTAPYETGTNDEYKGNSESVSRVIGPGASVTITTNISTLLGSGEASGDGKLLDTLRTIAKNMRGGSEGQALLGTTDLEKLDANIETLTQLQAASGSATDQLQTALDRNEQLQTTISASLANTDATNIPEASVQYANEQASYEAALRAGATIVQESLLNFLQ
ncbi:MAG: flagellar hook-associated protein FlgL [Solirubrobacteraceae bacterium]|jgi:flagellar hook-associated protein 3 FlgL